MTGSPAEVLAAARQSIEFIAHGDRDGANIRFVEAALDELAWQIDQLPVRERVRAEHDETLAALRRDLAAAEERADKAETALEDVGAERDEAVSDLDEARTELAEATDGAAQTLDDLRDLALEAATHDPADPAWDLYFEYDRRADVLRNPQVQITPTAPGRPTQKRTRRKNAKARSAG